MLPDMPASQCRLVSGPVSGTNLPISAGSHGPQHLDDRIDAFLTEFAPTLRDMPADEFEQHRATVIQARQQKDCSVADEAERFWEQISSRRSALRKVLVSFLQRRMGAKPGEMQF